MPALFLCLLSIGLALCALADDKELGLLEGLGDFSFSLDDVGLSEPTTLSKAWLGLGIQEMDPLESLLTAEGVRIIDLAPEAPAQEAGLRKGDILTHWNDQPITTSAALQERLATLKVDEEVTLKVHRNGASQSFKAKASDHEAYPWKDFWRPNLPNFEALEELEAVFDENEKTFEALKLQFEELEAKEDSKDAKNAKQTSSSSSEC